MSLLQFYSEIHSNCILSLGPPFNGSGGKHQIKKAVVGLRLFCPQADIRLTLSIALNTGKLIYSAEATATAATFLSSFKMYLIFILR